VLILVNMDAFYAIMDISTQFTQLTNNLSAKLVPLVVQNAMMNNLTHALFVYQDFSIQSIIPT